MHSIWILVSVVVALQATSPSDQIGRARRLNGEGKQDEAIALYREALQKAPDSYDANYGLGIALDLKGDYAGARTAFGKAIERAPEESKDQALGAMAVSYAFEADARHASTFYRQVFDRQIAAGNLNGAAETANALGRVYLESGDPNEAQQWYQTGHETALKQEKLPGDQIDLWELRWAHAQGRMAARRGRAADARKQVAAVKAIIDKGTVAEQAPQHPYLAGYVEFYLKDYRGALTLLANADQTDPFILSLIAQAREKTGDKAGARKTYEQILAMNGHSINNAFARPLAKRKLK